ncbi:MAG TPA: aminoglycoside phosphotransferase family protein [Mycobacteriales bacterium]|nr:aminoglycoside phosphotransferase family protein [Mycobacteriales bacterium]
MVAAETGRKWTVMGRVSGLFADGVHLVRNGDRLAALKVRTGPEWTARFAAAAPVVAALREHGYPAPEILGTGALPADRAYSLTEWVPGETRPRGDRIRVEALLDAASVHSQVHPAGERDWSAMVTAFLNGGVREFAFHPALEPLARRALALLPKPVPALPTGDFVHGDFSAANALFRNGTLRGIVDFDGFGRGTPAIDLVALAAHTDPGLQRMIVDRAVDLVGAEVVATCLCHRILAGLAWATEYPELLDGAVEQAAALMALIP